MTNTKEELRKEFYKVFTASHPGDSGIGGNDPQESVWELQYESPKEVFDWFMDKFDAHLEGIRKDLDKAWSFDENQRHTHTWHDKQDFLLSLTDTSHETEQSG